MTYPQRAYGFAIFPQGDAWGWEAYSREGRLRASGRAATRAVAAALVVREMTRSARVDDGAPKAAA